MYALELVCPEPDRDRLIAELWERGTAGIVEEPERLRAFFDAPFDVEAFRDFQPRWTREDERDWVEVARSQWPPLLVGARFFLVPEWRDDPAPEGRLRLVMRPGQACGTGWHPATRLCLEAMERHLRPGAAVLDIGTGSGILSIAAVLLGAGRVVACDIDHEAAVAARAACPEAAVFTGSARSVRSGWCDLAVANINAEAVVQLAAEIGRALRPGAVAILSGFRPRNAARVLDAAGRAPIETLVKEDWCAVVW